MALRYHISPATGRPNLCRAETRDCPVGGSHYSSKDEARQAYEKEMFQGGVSLKSVQKGPAKKSKEESRKDRIKELQAVQASRASRGDKLRAEKESATPERRKEINGKLRGMGISQARTQRELEILQALEARDAEAAQAAEATAKAHPKLFTPEPEAFSEIDGDRWVEETLKDVHATEGAVFDEDEDEDDVWADDEETTSHPKAYSWD